MTQKLRQYIFDYNLFPSIPPSTDEHELRNQKISTRLFLLLFILILTILLLYTTLATVTKTATVNDPTMDQYSHLYNKYPQTLSCPCTKISINYEAFLHVEYSFHQVCTSDFVTNAWTSYLTITDEHALLDVTDFRWTGRQRFQIVRSLCELINNTMLYSLNQFYANQYVTVSTLSSELLQVQTSASVTQFQTATINSFLLSLLKIRDVTHINALFSALMTNYEPILEEDGYLNFKARVYDNCSCAASPTCKTASSIYDSINKTRIFTVPGMYIGCYVMESVLQSTLECFYNQSCITQLQSSYSSSSKPLQVTPLNQSYSSAYSPNSTVQQLIDKLMIERWNSTVMYDKYYDECKPVQCTYSYQARNDAIYIITTVVGLVGGLITILRLTVPRLIKLVRRKKQLEVIPDEVTTGEQSRNVFKKMKISLVTLNLFPSIPPSTDAHELRSQTISTRTFLTLLATTTAILFLYTSLATITKTVIVNSPTQIQYSQLYANYPQTLSCPCAKVSINYEKFLHVDYSLHQVCSSNFTTNQWIEHFSEFPNDLDWRQDDFKIISASALQSVKILCDLITTTITYGLNQFHSSAYISGIVMPSSLLHSEVDSSANRYRTSMTNSFLISLALMRDTTQTNAVFSALVTNYYLYNHGDHIHMRTKSYSNCYCSSFAICVRPTSLYEYVSMTRLFALPGMYIGCYVMESVLQSNLQCFYSQSCITQLQSSYSSLSSPLQITPLSRSQASVYTPNSTVQQLIDKLMIERWNSMVMYDKYYDECKPVQCTYSYQARNDAIYIITTVVGLVGGLITILRLTVPRLIKLARRKNQEIAAAEPSQPYSQRLKSIIENFNLFASIPPSTDELELSNQKISTRLFLLLFTLIMTILLLYTSLSTVTKTVTVKTPAMDHYSELYIKYPQTLSCPCTKISINYGDLLHIQYVLHQVCSSDFITKEWIAFLDFFRSPLYAHFKDFLLMGPQIFAGLRSFCNSITSILSNSLSKFYSNQYISAYVSSFELFQSQILLIVDQFRASLVSDYALSLAMMHETTEGNALQSVQMTNYELYEHNHTIMVRSSQYHNCSCAYSSTCTIPAAFYNYTNYTVTYAVPGIYTGCYFTKSLLLSSLECLYHKSCLTRLQSIYTWAESVETTALDKLQPSFFNPTSIVQQLIDRLMIEEWNASVLYDKYYQECEPAQCTYSYQTRNDVIYIITTLLGLVGGLVTVLKVITPRFVAFFRRLVLKRGRVQPHAAMAEN